MDAPDETEPDYRYSLANERTYLAWVRTGLAFVAGGLAVEQFASLGYRWVTPTVGLIAIVMGAVVVSFAYWHFLRVQRAMRRSQPLPPQPAVPAVVAAVTMIVVLLLIGIIGR